MLNFSVRNFKNFKETQTIDFENKETIVLLGQNGSGKTNILNALWFIKDFIVNLRNIGSNILNENILKSFKLDKNTINKYSEFEINFEIKNQKYLYYFSCDNNKVYKEELKIKKENKNNVEFKILNKNLKQEEYKLIYKRNEDKIEFFDTELKQKKIKENELNKYKNVLYLTLLSLDKERINFITDIYLFFKTKIYIFPSWFNQGITSGSLTIQKILENKNNDKNKILDFLNSCDLNIENIEINKEKRKVINNNITQEIIEFIPIFYRTNKQGENIIFNLLEESDGNIKIFCLAGDIINSVENGFFIAFDELDKSVHTELLISIIKLFKTQNKKNAKLLFTTHNPLVLDNRYDINEKKNIHLINNNEIYIVRKRIYGESEINCLNDLKYIRIDKQTSRLNLYLNGSLNSNPTITDFEIENE